METEAVEFSRFHFHRKRTASASLERVKASEELNHGEGEGGSEPGAWGGKSGLHSERRLVSRSRGRAGKENLPRSWRKYEQVSGRKSSNGGSGESFSKKVVLNAHIIHYQHCLEITFNFLKKFQNRLRNKVTNQYLSKLIL